MIERVTFKDIAPDPLTMRQEAEVVEVRLDRSSINVQLPPNRHASYGRGFAETRGEYGYRLRRAAEEAGRFLEAAILAEFRRMGHLV